MVVELELSQPQRQGKHPTVGVKQRQRLEFSEVGCLVLWVAEIELKRHSTSVSTGPDGDNVC